MTPVYLGFTDTLQGILKDVFDKVLTPVLTSVFNTLLDLLLNTIESAFSDLLLDGLIGLLKLVHYMEELFNIFSGAAEIQYGEEETTILEMLFNLNGISSAMFFLTLAAGVFAFVFAAVQTGKSISDSALDSDYKPISRVIQDGLKAMFSFLLVPFLCLLLLNASNIVLEQIDKTFDEATGDSKLNLDDIIFNNIAESAAKDAKTFQATYKSKSQQYTNRSQVKKDFSIKNIDYVSGYVSGLLIMLILLGAGIMFIRRCFELLILYFISPAFSATIALDGGARFAKWRNQFVGKFFAAFGSIFSMRLYMLVIPYFSSGAIQYSGDEALDSFMNLVMIIGGAWAVYKGSSITSQLLFGQSGRGDMGTAFGIAAAVRGGARSIFRRR